MTKRCGESKDCPKVLCGVIGHAILVKMGGLVDIARKGKEFKNPWTNERDGAGRSTVAHSQGRRIHGSHYGFIFVSAIQMMRTKTVTQ
jgi:hypothetical protein